MKFSKSTDNNSNLTSKYASASARVARYPSSGQMDRDDLFVELQDRGYFCPVSPGMKSSQENEKGISKSQSNVNSFSLLKGNKIGKFVNTVHSNESKMPINENGVEIPRFEGGSDCREW
jgi:hypothetical protein